MGYTIWPDGPTGAQIELVYKERARQEELKRNGKFDATCADNTMTDAECLAVLSEEFGEAAREVCEAMRNPLARKRLHTELIQVAAVAVAWCERLERHERNARKAKR